MAALDRNRPTDPPNHELDLIARANAGDRGALDSLFILHADWVVALAYRFVKNREDALDVRSDTFEYLCGRFPGFELRTTLRSFLYPVVKHRSLSLIRRRRRTVPLLDVTFRDGSERVAPDRTTGDFARNLAMLLPHQRDVVRLRFTTDLRLVEIADLLGLPVGTVKSRLHKAMRRLRRHHAAEVRKLSVDSEIG